jgi:hypothetical protein
MAADLPQSAWEGAAYADGPRLLLGVEDGVDGHFSRLREEKNLIAAGTFDNCSGT